MSKDFKSQDYFRYPKLGKRWRRPKGHQSKLRRGKGGSGRRPSVGYRTEKARRGTVNGAPFAVISSLQELDKTNAKQVLLSSRLGSKKAMQLAAEMEKLGIKILNKKKLKRAEKIAASIEKKKSAKIKAKEESKKEEAKKAEEKAKAENGKIEDVDKKKVQQLQEEEKTEPEVSEPKKREV